MPAADLAIRTRGLRKIFLHNVAVEGLTLEVPRGEVFGFLGPNGAGKSTSIKMLLGLVSPTSGDAELLGRRAGARDDGVLELPSAQRGGDHLRSGRVHQARSGSGDEANQLRLRGGDDGQPPSAQHRAGDRLWTGPVGHLDRR